MGTRRSCWRYYANNQAVKGWKQIEGKWFFFNAEGVSQKWWVQDKELGTT